MEESVTDPSIHLTRAQQRTKTLDQFFKVSFPRLLRIVVAAISISITISIVSVLSIIPTFISRTIVFILIAFLDISQKRWTRSDDGSTTSFSTHLSFLETL